MSQSILSEYWITLFVEGAVNPRLSTLPAFFCQPFVVQTRPNSLSNFHTVFCTPHR